MKPDHALLALHGYAPYILNKSGNIRIKLVHGTRGSKMGYRYSNGEWIRSRQSTDGHKYKAVDWWDGLVVPMSILEYLTGDEP